MARYVGDQSQACIVFESGTYANASGDGQWIGMVQSCEVTEDIGKRSVRYLQGATRDVGQHFDTVQKATAAVSFFPQDWRMLAFTLGSCVDTSGTNSTHVMTAVNSNSSNAFTSGTDAPFMSFQLEDAKRFNPTGLNHIKTMVGAMVNSLTINIPRGEPVTVDLNLIGAKVNYSSGAATSITAATTVPYLAQHATFSLPSGTQVNEVDSAVITINNGMVAEPWLNGSNWVSLPYPTSRDDSIELTVDGNTTWAKKFYDQYFKGGSEFNFFVRVAPSTTRFLELTFSGCAVPTMTDPTSSTGAQEQTITIKPKTCSSTAQDQIVKYNPW